MNEVHFTYNGLEGTVKTQNMKTEEELHQSLCKLFSLSESIDFTGVKHYENGRLYSLGEIVRCPSLFYNTPGAIIIGRRNHFYCIIFSFIAQVTQTVFICNCKDCFVVDQDRKASSSIFLLSAVGKVFTGIWITLF